MLALVVTALLTIGTGAVSITELQSAPSQQQALGAQPPPDDDTVFPVRLAQLVEQITVNNPDGWATNCEAFRSWFVNADFFQLTPQEVLMFTEMLDMWIIRAYEPDTLRLTPAARDWIVEKLHDECTGETPVGYIHQTVEK